MTHKVLKKHLKENNIIPIYLHWRDQSSYRGNAKLLKRLIDKEPSEEQKTYEFAAIGDNTIYDRKKDKISIIYSYQSWVIIFIDGPEKDFQTRVNIAYYKSTLYNRNKI